VKTRCEPFGPMQIFAADMLTPRQVGAQQCCARTHGVGGRTQELLGWIVRFLLVSLAEVKANVEFFLKEFSAAVGVYQVFGGIAVGSDAEADSTTLE
jgi:hypothetical protein